MFFRRERDLREQHERTLTLLREHYERVAARLDAQHEIDLTRLEERRARDEVRHDAEITKLLAVIERLSSAAATSAAGQVEALARLITTGSPVSVPPVIQSPDLDPVERLSRDATESGIQRGMDQLREEYRKIGVVPEDETLRDEVMMLLATGEGARFEVGRGELVPTEAIR